MSTTPNLLELNTTTDVTISGSNFQDSATIEISQRLGLKVLSTIFVDENSLIAKIRVKSNAILGARTIIITNPDGLTDELGNAFDAIE